MTKHRGVTLARVAIFVGVLAALFLISSPGLNAARAQSSLDVSADNLQQVGLSMLMYSNQPVVVVYKPIIQDTTSPFITITLRYIHIVTACVLFGGAFFFRMLLPFGARRLEPQAQQDVFLGSRRALKMVVHTAFLLLLVTGICEAVLYWPIYTRWPAVMHGLFGLHLLLGLGALVLLMIATAGREPLRSYMSIAKVGVLLLFLAVLAASILRWEREHSLPPPLRVSSNLH